MSFAALGVQAPDAVPAHARVPLAGGPHRVRVRGGGAEGGIPGERFGLLYVWMYTGVMLKRVGNETKKKVFQVRDLGYCMFGCLLGDVERGRK